MERVVTINLNGNAYQLDESAYDALRAYLAAAEAALANNPDKDEIVRDLEQAVADKANNYLSSAKGVLSKSEVERIITEMGPVEGEGQTASQDDGEGQRASAQPGAEQDRPRKRLYRLRDNAMIAGVASGMSAYFDVEVTWIRIFWVIATLVTGGGALLVYIVMMFIVPSANTSEEWAEARGLPHTAQGVVDEAKRRYAEFEAKGGFRSEWRQQRRAWRRWRREHGPFFYDVNYSRGGAPPAPPVKPAGYFTRFVAGIFAFIFSVIGAVLTIAFIVALLSLITSPGHTIFGWVPPGDLPLWVLIVILCIVFAALSGPFSAIRRASYATVRGRHYNGPDPWSGLTTLVIILLAGWIAWTTWPEARAWLESIPDALRAIDWNGSI